MMSSEKEVSRKKWTNPSSQTETFNSPKNPSTFIPLKRMYQEELMEMTKIQPISSVKKTPK